MGPFLFGEYCDNLCQISAPFKPDMACDPPALAAAGWPARVTAAAKISENVWVTLKIIARNEGRTMNDLIGQALTEWLASRQAAKNQQTEQGEIEKMKLMRKKGRPVMAEKNRKWTKDKTGRKSRNLFYVPKEKASGQ